MTKSNRIVYLDVLRVIACFSVIMVHSCAQYFVKDIGSFNFWVGNIFDGLARIGVPLFIMISGALMLDKNYQFSTQKLIKHIIKMIAFFAFWSVFYCFMFKIVGSIIIKHESIDIINIIGSLIKGHYHLWFVYLIIGLYLIVPLLRLWVNDTNKKYVEYFIILSINHNNGFCLSNSLSKSLLFIFFLRLLILNLLLYISAQFYHRRLLDSV